MADITQGEESEFVPWYLDELSEPVCPSFWEDFECEKSSCPFSHKLAKFQSSIVLAEDHSEDIQVLYRYVKQFLDTLGVKESIQGVKFNQEFEEDEEEEKDIGRINQLINEMAEFERGPRIENQEICPFELETGNCLIKNYCEFTHSTGANDAADSERHSEWYPSSMDCECCKGYVYGCSSEACRKNQKCLICVS